MPRSALKRAEPEGSEREWTYAKLIAWRQAGKDPKERQRRILAFRARATFTNRLQPPCPVAESSALAWLIGWDRRTFPGLYRALEQVFIGKATKTAAVSWYRRGKAPSWALRRLLELMVERVSEGQAIIERLRSAIDEADARARDPGRHLREWRATRHAAMPVEPSAPIEAAEIVPPVEAAPPSPEASGVGVAHEL